MKKQMTFESSLTALNEIVDRLEKGQIPLEEAITQYEKGIELSQHCQHLLDNAEQRIKQLKENNELTDFEK